MYHAVVVLVSNGKTWGMQLLVLDAANVAALDRHVALPVIQPQVSIDLRFDDIAFAFPISSFPCIRHTVSSTHEISLHVPQKACGSNNKTYLSEADDPYSSISISYYVVVENYQVRTIHHYVP